MLIALKAGVLPVPAAANPIVGLELVQVKVPPTGKLVKAEAGIGSPGQTVIFAGTIAKAPGLTVMV